MGLDKILDLSAKLDVYDEIPEILSVSLGASETTLINLTSAYAIFVNGGNKIEPTLISRIQDRRGKTIFQVKNRKCLGCEKFIDQSGNEIPGAVPPFLGPEWGQTWPFSLDKNDLIVFSTSSDSFNVWLSSFLTALHKPR